MSRLRKAIKQTRPFRSRTHEATVALLRTADEVRRSVASAIEPHGITIQQYNVLRILRGAGETGLPTLDIADRMVERTPGITRLLDRLEAKKLVRRERCRKDRRQVLCFSTPRSLELLSELDEVVDRADADAMKGLGAKDLSNLIRLLDEIRGAE